MNRIRTAIRTQPLHRPVSTLTDEQILLIAMALREGEEKRRAGSPVRSPSKIPHPDLLSTRPTPAGDRSLGTS